MTNSEYIQLLKRVRQRATSSSSIHQLLDYIDGQIDVISTLDKTDSHSYQSNCINTRSITPTSTPKPKFHGADMED